MLRFVERVYSETYKGIAEIYRGEYFFMVVYFKNNYPLIRVVIIFCLLILYIETINISANYKVLFSYKTVRK